MFPHCQLHAMILNTVDLPRPVRSHVCFMGLLGPLSLMLRVPEPPYNTQLSVALAAPRSHSPALSP